MRKINFAPLTNKPQLPDIPQISSQRAMYQYLVQLEKWQQIRQKVKSMHLNKIQVTSYINKNKRNVNSSCDKQNQLNHSQNRGTSLFHLQNKNRNTDRTQLVQSINSSPKIFRSRNGARSSFHNRANFLAPYMANAFKLQINKLKIGQKIPQRNIPNQKVQNPQHNQQSNDVDQQKAHKQKISGEYTTKSSIQKKMKKRQNNLIKSKTQSNNSSYSKGKIMPTNINNRQPIRNNNDLNDLVEFCKVSSKDITERVIIRRKSNINPSDGTIQAIQVSILKKKIILFIVDVTSGNANEFTDVGIRPPSNLSNQFQVSYPSPTQKQAKVKTHTPTRTYQMKLLLGTKQISQYLQYFGLSQHPLQVYNSTQKLAIILVDMLKITANGLKLDKNQFINLRSINEQNKKQLVQQTCKKLQNSQLIRWKNQNHNKRNQLDVINSPNKISEYLKKQSIEAQYYKAYGHPHPLINGKQYQNIESYEHDHPLQSIKSKKSKELQKNKKKTIQNKINELIDEMTIQKTISQKDSINKFIEQSSQQPIISNQNKLQQQICMQKISLQKNDQIDENIDENIGSQKQTLSMVDESIPNET